MHTHTAHTHTHTHTRHGTRKHTAWRRAAPCAVLRCAAMRCGAQRCAAPRYPACRGASTHQLPQRRLGKPEALRAARRRGDDAAHIKTQLVDAAGARRQHGGDRRKKRQLWAVAGRAAGDVRQPPQVAQPGEQAARGAGGG
eukprot:362480-Chlamydomonas_euryale.AAC.8